MIEDIKKEISNLTTFNGGHNRMHISELFKILDKYNNRDNATAIIEDVISTIRDFKENDIEAICKVLLNKYRNVCGNCLKCDYYELYRFKNAWEELKDLHLKTKGELSKETINEFDIKIYGKINELEIKHGIEVSNE